MNKTELIDAIAAECDLPKSVAQKALDAVFNQVMKATAAGDPVQLVGFGSFSVGTRAERTGRHPRTGEEIKIAASKTVRFAAGKAFKDALNHSGDK